MRPKEFWIGYDGVNDRGYWVDIKKPSGISGGGSNRSIHVIDYALYKEALKKIKSLEKQLEVNNERKD